MKGLLLWCLVATIMLMGMDSTPSCFVEAKKKKKKDSRGNFGGGGMGGMGGMGGGMGGGKAQMIFINIREGHIHQDGIQKMAKDF